MKGELGANCVPPGNCVMLYTCGFVGNRAVLLNGSPRVVYLIELSVSTIILKKGCSIKFKFKHLKANAYPINAHLCMPVTVCEVGLGIRRWAEGCEAIAYPFLCTVRIIPTLLGL